MKKIDKIKHYINQNKELYNKIILAYAFDEESKINKRDKDQYIDFFILDANKYISALKRKRIYCLLLKKYMQILEVKHSRKEGVHFRSYLFLIDVFDIKKPNHFVFCVSYYANYTLLSELSKIGFVKESKILELVGPTYGKIE